MATYVPAECVVLLNQALDADAQSASPANVSHLVVWNTTTNCIQYVDQTTGEIVKEICANPAESCATGLFVSQTEPVLMNNVSDPAVFSLAFNIILEPGKWRINFGSNVQAIADPGPSERCIVQLNFNTNTSSTGPDLSDTTIATIEHRGLDLLETSDWKICAELTTLVPVIIKIIYQGVNFAPPMVIDQYQINYRTLDATLICQVPD